MAIKKGSTRDRMLQLLALRPDGMHAKDIAAELKSEMDCIAEGLSVLRKAGLLVSVLDPLPAGKGGANRVRWCAPEHESSCRSAVRAAQHQARQTDRESNWGRKGLGLVRKPGEPVTTGPRITIAPPFIDRRFVPDRVEPFFSARRLGEYLSTGTAIERAYGGSEGLQGAASC